MRPYRQIGQRFKSIRDNAVVVLDSVHSGLILILFFDEGYDLLNRHVVLPGVVEPISKKNPSPQSSRMRFG
jgi:hypothetical protein